MGLDMNLWKKTYIGNQYAGTLNRKMHRLGIDGVKDERVSEIVESVGYWRKANAIHAWFVENVQDGEDDCKEYYVSREQLKELLDIVDTVLKASKLVKGKVTNGYSYENGERKPILEDGEYIENPEVAKKLLPTTEGFFFGGTEYDQWYYKDLENTKTMLEELLQEESGEFYYSSSW